VSLLGYCWAVEMTRCGNDGKPTAGFPPFPRTLGNRTGGDFHIPTAPATVTLSPKQNQNQRPYGNRGKVEIQSRDFHFPTVPICLRRKEKVTMDCPEEQLISSRLD
jgi:hypothetical protein